MDMSVAPLTNEIHGMVVCFDFKIKGICPLGGVYTGTCEVTYIPKEKFVDVELLAARQFGARVIAENMALAVFLDMVATVGIEIPIKIEMAVTSPSHGPIHLSYNPSCFDWSRIRQYL